MFDNLHNIIGFMQLNDVFYQLLQIKKCGTLAFEPRMHCDANLLIPYSLEKHISVAGSIAIANPFSSFIYD